MSHPRSRFARSAHPLSLNKLAAWAILGAGLLHTHVASAQEKTARIGVIVDGKSDFYEKLGEQFRKEVIALTKGEFRIEVDESKIIRCDFTEKCVSDGLDKLLDDQKIDLVIAHGFIASNELLERKRLKKPALAPFVVDPRAQGLDPTVQRKNLAYILWSVDIGTDLRAFEKVVPFSNVALLVGKAAWASMPDALKDHIIASGKNVGKKITIVEIDETDDKSVENIPSNIDAVFVGPLLRMKKPQREKLAQALLKRRLPSFTWSGEAGVLEGFLAGTTSVKDSARLARRFALSVQSLLIGEKPSTVRATASHANRMFLNGDVARQLGVSPSVQSLLDTTILGGSLGKAQAEAKTTGIMTLKEAIELALQANLTINIANEGVKIRKQEAKQSRSPLLPQIGLSIGGRIIDADRISPGNAERQANWSANLYQSIFSERSWGSYKTAKFQTEAQEHNRESTRLNVVLDVSTAYLDLLRAETARRIQSEDLSLSRENLDLARIRHRVGQAGLEEVYRWESRIAQSRRSLLDAIAQMAISRVQLNTLLNRPAETAFVPEHLKLESSGLLSSNATFRGYLESPKHFQSLLDFSVQEGLNRAPELREYNAQMQGVRRQVNAEKRAYFLPEVGIEGTFNHRFAAGGGQFNFAGLNQDKIDWSIGISAELPLFEGALKNSAIGKGNAQYGQLSAQKKNVANQIERDVRQSFYRAAASYAGIAITRDAERAAEGNLKILRDKYQRGRATIIELLDAQNQSIVAQDEAANAVFLFLSDLMLAERATGRFDYLTSAEEQNSFVQRLESFNSEKGLATPPKPVAPDEKKN